LHAVRRLVSAVSGSGPGDACRVRSG
jgi:hypothetical protein